jgi:iron complex outermembrane receptor protein
VRFFPTVWAFAALVIAVGPSQPARGQNAAIAFHIPAKPMADALVDYAVQAGLSISDSGIDFGGAASDPVDGRFTREAGLRQLLADSGFEFRFVDANSVRITVPARALPPLQQPAGIERVVVTASKLEEVAESAPHSVAVATGAQMQPLDVKTTHDLTADIAGLTATNLGPGEDKLFVRGLTDSVLPGLSESVVGLYMDDTQIASDAPDPNLRLVDVERVEVLRGPQGSLYGAGALTGLVRIVTREPVFDRFEMSAGGDTSFTFDGAPSQSAQVALNLPLIDDQLAVRLVGYADALGGYVDEVRFHRDNTNDTRIAGFRAAAAWRPFSDWTVSAHVAYQRTRSDDSQYYDQDLGADKRDNYLYEPHSDDFLLASVSAHGSLGWADFVSNSAFVNRDFQDRFDATLAWPQLTGLPFGPAPFDYARTIRSFTHETRISSTQDSRWQWIAGLFLSHEDEDFRSSLFGPGPAGAIVNGRSETREDRTNEAALFGQVTYNFSEDFSASAGARAFDASHEVSATTTGLLAVAPQFRGGNNQKGFAPQLSVAYKPNYDSTYYLSYSEGYRLGGLNVDGPQNATDETEPAFDSDTLRNYEAGAKLRLFDGLAVANAAVYFSEWRNVQTDQIAPDGAFYILNAGDVRDLGVELEGSAEVLHNLHLSGNVFWNNPGLSRTNPLLVTTEGSLPGAPAVSFGITARYDHALTPDMDAFAAFEYSYVGSSHLGFSETTPAMGNYQLMNLRLGLMWQSWQAILFAENLTNERGNTFAFGNPFSLAFERQITPPRPRTVGLSLTWAMQP